MLFMFMFMFLVKISFKKFYEMIFNLWGVLSKFGNIKVLKC